MSGIYHSNEQFNVNCNIVKVMKVNQIFYNYIVTYSAINKILQGNNGKIRTITVHKRNIAG